MTVKVAGDGNFQLFNDVVSELNGISYFDEHNSPKFHIVPSASSGEMHSIEISLKQILSRIPGLERLYKMTFYETANVQPVSFFEPPDCAGYCLCRIDDPELFVDRDSLRKIVRRLRERFPFLRNWPISEAQLAWGYSVITFMNIVKAEGFDDLSEENLLQEDTWFRIGYDVRSDPITYPRFPYLEKLDPLAGGYSGSNSYAMTSINGIFPSEFALHYLGLFLLSSLVRYRPQTWVHALSRASNAEAPADDQALALIEEFLSLNSSNIPSFVVKVITEGLPTA